jgi:nucleotide-binding universal stress UspA family protein
MFKKILVPLDGSELAAKVLPHVEDLAKTMQAEVTLFSTGTYGIKEEIGEASQGIIEDAVKHAKEEAEKYLIETTNTLKAKGIRANYAYQEGMPAREIIAYAEKNGYDLIALASHGKGEVAWVLGSVAERVISHATVPVLLLRVLETRPPLLKEEFFMGA